MNSTLKNKVACAIEPDTFSKPRINLYLEDYQKAWIKADAAISVVLEEVCKAIQEDGLKLKAKPLDYLNWSIYSKGVLDGYDHIERIIKNLANVEDDKAIDELKPPVDGWKNIAEAYAKEVKRYRNLLECSKKILKPFAGCIYNDNGDITVTYSTISDQYSAYVDAYFLHRKIKKELSNG